MGADAGSARQVAGSRPGCNPKVAPEKRIEKREISNWFHVWLETPEMFSDWLAVRKQTAEFKRLAGEE